jgi:hypothetical protein
MRDRTQFCGSLSSPYWAGGLVDCPYFDFAGVNAATTTEMLLQSYAGATVRASLAQGRRASLFFLLPPHPRFSRAVGLNW